MLLSKVPKEKIHFNKKVLSMEQNRVGAMIRCADGTTYHGDVLVGADGAYSSVRQGLYKTLERKKALPPSDAQDLSKGFNCLVGTTDPLDPVKFPIVTKENCIFTQVIGKGTHYTLPVAGVIFWRSEQDRLPTAGGTSSRSEQDQLQTAGVFFWRSEQDRLPMAGVTSSRQK
jgi:2-polyprenyl-6-methoxyphenol hydroxylase-like FAD-dependent oxidoreductase